MNFPFAMPNNMMMPGQSATMGGFSGFGGYNTGMGYGGGFGASFGQNGFGMGGYGQASNMGGMFTGLGQGAFNPYMQQGVNPYMQQGFNPYIQQGVNPYMQQGFSPYMQQGVNPYMQQGFSPYMQQGVNPYMQQGFSPYSQMNGGMGGLTNMMGMMGNGGMMGMLMAMMMGGGMGGMGGGVNPQYGATSPTSLQAIIDQANRSVQTQRAAAQQEAAPQQAPQEPAPQQAAAPQQPAANNNQGANNNNNNNNANNNSNVITGGFRSQNGPTFNNVTRSNTIGDQNQNGVISEVREKLTSQGIDGSNTRVTIIDAPPQNGRTFGEHAEQVGSVVNDSENGLAPGAKTDYVYLTGNNAYSSTGFLTRTANAIDDIVAEAKQNPAVKRVGNISMGVSKTSEINDQVKALEASRGRDLTAQEVRNIVQDVENTWNSASFRAAKAEFDASVKAALDAGVIVVVSAGNEGRIQDALKSKYGIDTNDLNVLAQNPSVISVGATASNGSANGSDDTISSFSSGRDTFNPTLAAPGASVEVVSTNNNGQQGESTASGTSFSSPYVAATIALMLDANPTITGAQIIALLKQTADNIAGNGDGSGVVDPVAAALAAKAAAGN